MPPPPGAPAPAATRHAWIDALRLTAGLSMVGLHATVDGAGQPFPDHTASERLAPMLLRAVLYSARTELFLMISVFLLLLALDHRPRRYRVVLAQQARRLLVPFLFWTVFYAFYGLGKARAFGYFEAEWARLGEPLSWLGFLTLGNVKYHMHFVPTLFGLLLFYPLFRPARARPALGLLILGALLVKREVDGLIYPAFWGSDLLPYLVRATKIVTYAGYGLAAAAILGLWQRLGPGRGAPWVAPLLLLGGLLFAVKLSATAQVVASGAWAFDHTAGYWADFLMPAVLMGLCMCLGHRRWPALFSRLARYSFGIYLCHPIFLDLAEIALARIALMGAELAPLPLVLVKIAWTLPATALFVRALSRHRPLAWTIGLGPLPRRPGPHPKPSLTTGVDRAHKS